MIRPTQRARSSPSSELTAVSSIVSSQSHLQVRNSIGRLWDAVDCSELAEPDLARYPTLNTFFYRLAVFSPNLHPLFDAADGSRMSQTSPERCPTSHGTEESFHRLERGRLPLDGVSQRA